MEVVKDSAAVNIAPRMRRVMLCTPMLFRQPSTEFLISLQKTTTLLAQNGIALDSCYIGGDCFVGKARNGLVQTFIESWTGQFPSEVLVFMDDDQAWEEHAFLRIIQDPHEFIGVCVPKKTEPMIFNNVQLDQDEKGNCYIENGLLRASMIGSGFIALKRSMIEKMMKAYPQQYSPGDGGTHQLHYNFFEAGITWPAEGWSKEKPGQFWGEDLNFCKKWVALGEKIWIDPNVQMVHVGRKCWVGNFLEFLQKHADVNVEDRRPVQPIQPIVPSQAIPETLAAIEKLAA